MLLEIENELYKKVHEAVGQSAVVHRLAENLESSGAVIENTNIVISFSGSNINNPNKGAYVPTVRNRQIFYKITIVQKQSQRVGHSFALPILDVIADYVTGWVPCIKGLKFQTGFELTSERFIQITEASQYIYEQSYTIEVLIPDGRMVSSICAASDPLNLCEYIPSKKCLVTKTGKKTPIALWKIRTGLNSYEEFIVFDEIQCPSQGDFSYECDPLIDGQANYRFVPFEAYYYDFDTLEVKVDETKVITGVLNKFHPCLKNKPGYKVFTNLWRNTPGKLGERVDPRFSSIIPSNLDVFYNDGSTIF